MTKNFFPKSRDIEPIFKQRNVQLYLGDCLKVLESMSPESVDMIFADPPYNLSNGGTSVHAGRRVSVDKGDWDKSSGPKEDFDFHYKWIEACRRVLKKDGTIWISGTYHSIYACGYALQLLDFRLLNDVAWFKPNAAPNLGCRMFTASHETLLWASKSKKSKHTFNYEVMKYGDFSADFIKKPGKQMRSLWSLTTPKKEEKVFGKHPTQKPEALLDRIILASTNPGDVVLDPFSGSATTGVSALAYGRKYIGIDSNEDYIRELAHPRLTSVKRRKLKITEPELD
jgi:site-specific DNA-methyltransferase (adenine-specific)